jgi:hypothetical protein
MKTVPKFHSNFKVRAQEIAIQYIFKIYIILFCNNVQDTFFKKVIKLLLKWLFKKNHCKLILFHKIKKVRKKRKKEKHKERERKKESKTENYRKKERER